MEQEVDLMEEREMLVGGDPGATVSQEQIQPSCQDDLSIQPSQSVPLRLRQRTRQHDPVRPWKSLPATPTGDLETDPADGLAYNSFILALLAANCRPNHRKGIRLKKAAKDAEDELVAWVSFIDLVMLEHVAQNSSVFFSSLTSLQAEEFFDMVATVQARRLNDQRADFAGAENTSAENSGVSEEQLYDTILAHQSQRLEDQRTEPPIPVGVQGLLDLLLRAQGTRMEDQRSPLPPGLAAPSLLTRQPPFLHSV
ncbi:G-protein-signaling modulator 3 [Varanus komodoensis]|nr:G-protein-signaling modulator 3 [Varanus komodoensis]